MILVKSHANQSVLFAVVFLSTSFYPHGETKICFAQANTRTTLCLIPTDKDTHLNTERGGERTRAPMTKN